jgi:hypothetical protein
MGECQGVMRRGDGAHFHVPDMGEFQIGLGRQYTAVNPNCQFPDMRFCLKLGAGWGCSHIRVMQQHAVADYIIHSEHWAATLRPPLRVATAVTIDLH